jgi:hypothetical protein
VVAPVVGYGVDWGGVFVAAVYCPTVPLAGAPFVAGRAGPRHGE